MEKIKPPIFLYVAIILLLVLIALNVLWVLGSSESLSHGNVSLCKESVPFKAYWEEQNTQYDILNWYYDSTPVFYTRFDIVPLREESIKKTSFIEIYNRSSGIDAHYYIEEKGCIKDSFIAPTQKFDVFENRPCLSESNYLKNLSSEFEESFFAVPQDCKLRVNISK